MSKLQEEIKQTRPFTSLEEEAYLNLQRTAYILSVRNDAVIKAEGLSRVQYNVLRILRGAGADGLPSTEVGNRLVTKDPDMTRLLERLEVMQTITRERQPMDRRVINVRITQVGLDLLAKLDLPTQESVKRSLGHLGEEMLEQFNALLVLARS